MAKKVVTTLIDDMDGGKADETVQFAVDGVQYEIDLSADKAAHLRYILAGYVKAARQLTVKRSRQNGKADTDPAPAVVRVWANQNGYQLSGRGRIPQEIRSAYAAAH